MLAVADFFLVDRLPPYDSAELIPQKGDAAMALRILRRSQELLAAIPATAVASAEELAPDGFSHQALEATLRSAAQEMGIKAGQMFQPIRVAVCGRKQAPPLFETLEVLGREKSLERIEQAIRKIQ